MPSFSALVRPCAEHPSVWLLVSASLLDLELVVVEPKFVPALFGEARIRAADKAITLADERTAKSEEAIRAAPEPRRGGPSPRGRLRAVWGAIRRVERVPPP